MIIGEGINSKADTLTFLDATDVGLVNVGNHLHVRQIFGYRKQLRGVERSSHRLAFLYRLRQHHAVDRTGDGGITQIGLCLVDTLLCRLHAFAGLLVGQTGILVVISTHQSFIVQRLVALIVRTLIVECALCRSQISTGGVQLAGQIGLVQLGNHLSLLDHRIVVNIEF